MNRILGAFLFLLGLAVALAQEPAEPAVGAAPALAPADVPAAESTSDRETPAPATTAPGPEKATAAPPATGVVIYVMPVRGEISKPTLYIIRKGVKEAIEAQARFVVLNMDTPGGGLGETLEIMEILDRFDGRVVTFVDREAGSAGAIIAAVTDEVYFAPKSVIGAAEVVLATGEDVGSSMKRKITSFLSAKVRAFAEGQEARSKVLQAMMDPSFELTIGGEVIKKKDELLTLTATEAMKEYGDPPAPLFGAGIVDDLPGLYRTLAGGPDYQVREFEVTWSVELARWLTMFSPLLLSVGGLLLFIEFKTPGFGLMGVSGIVLILIVLFGHHVAGLSGNEAMLVFLLGFALVMTELIFFPGTVVLAVSGLMLMAGALLWGMADIWPGQGMDFPPNLFLRPLINMGLGLVLAVAMGLALVRFLPKGWFFQQLAVAGAGLGSAQVAGATLQQIGGLDELIGRTGVAVTGLFPSGQIDVDGQRYQARVDVGTIERGATVVVKRRSDFNLIVEKKPS